MAGSMRTLGSSDNEAIFKPILDDDEFRDVLTDLYAKRAYQRARKGAP